MLTMRGHRVRIAIKPQDALRTWAKHSASLDLVICDVAMAETRGPELVARLAKVGGPPRVLFITGYSEEAVHSALRHPVLAKPFTAQALWSAVSAAMG
jgi:two-component system cell cycle sensor histidine kinase/response regulator CckA